MALRAAVQRKEKSVVKVHIHDAVIAYTLLAKNGQTLNFK